MSNKIFAGFCLSKAFFIIHDLFSIFRQSVYKVFPIYMDVIFESTFFLKHRKLVFGIALSKEFLILVGVANVISLGLMYFG